MYAYTEDTSYYTHKQQNVIQILSRGFSCGIFSLLYTIIQLHIISWFYYKHPEIALS